MLLSTSHWVLVVALLYSRGAFAEFGVGDELLDACARSVHRRFDLLTDACESVLCGCYCVQFFFARRRSTHPRLMQASAWKMMELTAACAHRRRGVHVDSYSGWTCMFVLSGDTELQCIEGRL